MAKNPVVAVAPATVVQPQPHIVLTGKAANFKPGTARALWFACVASYNGQPLAAYVAYASANPPSLPTKGKSAGQLESVRGWVKFFSDCGLANVVNM